jgi:hypothetical protein
MREVRLRQCGVDQDHGPPSVFVDLTSISPVDNIGLRNADYPANILPCFVFKLKSTHSYEPLGRDTFKKYKLHQYMRVRSLCKSWF